MNGVVLRGGDAWNTLTNLSGWRCGRRYGYKNVGTTYTGRAIGFRLNGMNRGGYYSATYGVSRDVRSASRVDRRLSNVNPGIGFL